MYKIWINGIISQYQGFALISRRGNFPISLIIGKMRYCFKVCSVVDTFYNLHHPVGDDQWAQSS